MLLRHDQGAGSASCEVLRLNQGGRPLGILEPGSYEETEMVLHKGDRLVIFTDGVTEAENQQGEEFGEQRLIAMASSLWDFPASVIGGRILEEVIRFAGNCPQSDDITLMVAKVG